jgi:hypothetical protein
MAVSDVENAETAEAVEVLFAVDVAISVGSGVGPFDGRGGVLDRRRFPVLEESRIDVISEVLNCFACDPRGLFRRDRRRLDKV